VLDSGCEHQQVSDAERILLTERLEDHPSFENVDAHRPIGVMSREITARRQGQDRKTKRPLLDERSRASPVTGHEGLIYCLLISREMADEHFA
jgi:hypothetical protein